MITSFGADTNQQQPLATPQPHMHVPDLNKACPTNSKDHWIRIFLQSKSQQQFSSYNARVRGRVQVRGIYVIPIGSGYLQAVSLTQVCS